MFSRQATGAQLLLYEAPDSPRPFQIITLNPRMHRTFFAWHVYVVDLPVGIHYTWRVDGPPGDQENGFRFDRNIDLLDPWARAVTDTLWDRWRGDGCMRAMVTGDDFDWEGDTPLRIPMAQTIIYELHVGGFTRHPSAGVAHPGTYAGVIEKIPYLKALGITAVELLPVMAFDPQDVAPGAYQRGLSNYWGYSTHSFFSPHPGYCQTPDQGTHGHEFRAMVKALHAAGIEVLMDVVYNHTAEGGSDGPTISFKGFGNEMFYHLQQENRTLYRDYSGCGNTINCNHPLVTHFIVDSLEYWVREMHVDGFRFDLASCLVRGEDGTPVYHAPAPWNIELSETLIHTKLIAEAWDAGGLYQVGGFPGYRWAEWNGRYRDVVRRFVRGDPGLVSEVATRVSGSSDLYAPSGRLPINSINFVTCHDGFTLNDLVSYNDKYNESNGEDNRDGTNDNLSWNCGVEGASEDPQVLKLRLQQAKNFIAILLLSNGVPMLLAGDELLRTQQGNNNAYCQDNALSWIDWSLAEKNREMLHFVREMIHFRKRHPCLMRRGFLSGTMHPGQRLPDVRWHGDRLNEPAWDDPSARLLAFTLAGLAQGEEDVHVIFNMSDQALQMPLPEVAGRIWHRAVDTALKPPRDVAAPADQRPVHSPQYRVQERSVVVLESRTDSSRDA